MSKLKEILKDNPQLLRLAALFYNIIHFNIPPMGRFQSVFLKKTSFQITGKRLILDCGVGSRLINCNFHVEGDDAVIKIGKKCILSNVEFWIEDSHCQIVLGDYITFEGGQIAATEGKSIEIGDDCMFSSNIQIRNGDSHPIFDKVTGQRTNNAASVKIGTHVWLGANTTVLKGVTVADNSIVATGAILSGKYADPGCIYAGIPAKKIKEGIIWKRHR